MKSLWDVNNKPEKNFVRNDLLSNRIIRNSLFLPGDGCKDINLFVEKKLLDKNSVHALVERNSNIMGTIKEKTKNLGFKFKYYNDDLHNIKINEELDYVNIDLLGSLTFNVSMWLRNYIKFTNGAKLIINFARIPRRNGCQFVKSYFNYIKYNNNLDNKIDELHLIEKSSTNYWHDRDLFCYEFLLKCLLQKYDIKIEKIIPYCDDPKWEMLTFSIIINKNNSVIKYSDLNDFFDFNCNFINNKFHVIKKEITDFNIKNKTCHVAIYFNDGITENRELFLIKHCVKNNYNIVSKFKDFGSTSHDKRNGLNSLYELIKNKKIDKVIVYSLEDLGLNFIDTIINFFSAYNVKIEQI